MTASALRPKANTRRLLHFLGISLAVHLVMLVVFSLDFLFGEKPKPVAEAAAPATPAAPAPAAPAPPATAPGKPAAAPTAPEKPKNADAEYQKRQKPLSDEDKQKAGNLRPDLDQLK